MAWKRKRLVVTVTERWTFVIDGAGAAPAPTTDLPAPVPSSSLLGADPNVPLEEGDNMVASPNPAAHADDDAV